MSDSFATLWTAAHQAPLSTGFPRQEYWSGLPFPSPEGLPHPGIKLTSPALAGGIFTTEPPGKPKETIIMKLISLRRRHEHSFSNTIINVNRNPRNMKFHTGYSSNWVIKVQSPFS